MKFPRYLSGFLAAMLATTALAADVVPYAPTAPTVGVNVTATAPDASTLTRPAQGVVLINPDTGAAYTASGGEGGGAGTEFAEDAAHSSGALGSLVFCVRRDTPASSSGTTLDYSTLNCSSSGNLYVDVQTSALPTGAATATNQTTIIGHVDGLETLLGGTLLVGDGSGALTIDGNLTNISGTISLPTGAATSNKQPALGTAGTASADVITVQGIASGTNLNVNCAAGCSGGTQFAEDLAAVSADAGTVALTVRRDTAATSSGTDGDYSTLNTDASGRLWTNSVAAGDVANSAVDSGNPVKMGCVYTTSPAAISTTNRSNCQADNRGNIKITLMSQDSGTVGATVSGSSADALSNSTGALQVQGNNKLYNGSTWDRMQAISAAFDDAGPGVQAVGITAQLDNTSTATCTENQFCPLRLTEARAMVVSEAGSSFTNITTNTDTNIKASPGTMVRLVVNTGGTTSTAAIYNDADGTCSSGLIGTFSTTAQTSITINAAATVGICVTTAGAGAADITVMYR